MSKTAANQRSREPEAVTVTHPYTIHDLRGLGKIAHFLPLALIEIDMVHQLPARVGCDQIREVFLEDIEGVCEAVMREGSRLHSCNCCTPVTTNTLYGIGS